MVFWVIFPVLELPLFAGNQQKWFGITDDKLGLLVVSLGFVVGLKGASESVMSWALWWGQQRAVQWACWAVSKTCWAISRGYKWGLMGYKVGLETLFDSNQYGLCLQLP